MNFLTQLWAWLTPRAISAEQLAVRDYEDARRDLLVAESRLEECQAAVAAYNARIDRLSNRIKENQA